MGEARMFHVIVLGGIALATTRGCGGVPTRPEHPATGPDAGDGFPIALSGYQDGGPDSTADASEETVSELPGFIDAAPEVGPTDSGSDADAKLPASPRHSAPRAPLPPPEFPRETPF